MNVTFGGAHGTKKKELYDFFSREVVPHFISDKNGNDETIKPCNKFPS